MKRIFPQQVQAMPIVLGNAVLVMTLMAAICMGSRPKQQDDVALALQPRGAVKAVGTFEMTHDEEDKIPVVPGGPVLSTYSRRELIHGSRCAEDEGGICDKVYRGGVKECVDRRYDHCCTCQVEEIYFAGDHGEQNGGEKTRPELVASEDTMNGNPPGLWLPAKSYQWEPSGEGSTWHGTTNAAAESDGLDHYVHMNVQLAKIFARKSDSEVAIRRQECQNLPPRQLNECVERAMLEDDVTKRENFLNTRYKAEQSLSITDCRGHSLKAFDSCMHQQAEAKWVFRVKALTGGIIRVWQNDDVEMLPPGDKTVWLDNAERSCTGLDVFDAKRMQTVCRSWTVANSEVNGSDAGDNQWPVQSSGEAGSFVRVAFFPTLPCTEGETKRATINLAALQVDVGTSDCMEVNMCLNTLGNDLSGNSKRKEDADALKNDVVRMKDCLNSDDSYRQEHPACKDWFACLSEKGTMMSTLKGIINSLLTISSGNALIAPSESTSSGCDDKHRKCGEWAGKGYCDHNTKDEKNVGIDIVQKAQKLCPKSCNKCSGTQRGSSSYLQLNSTTSFPKWCMEHRPFNVVTLMNHCECTTKIHEYLQQPAYIEGHPGEDHVKKAQELFAAYHKGKCENQGTGSTGRMKVCEGKNFEMH